MEAGEQQQYGLYGISERDRDSQQRDQLTTYYAWRDGGDVDAARARGHRSGVRIRD